MGQNGVSVTINNLTMSDGRIGVVWPALVRAMLDQPRASAAYEVLCRTPLSSGHHYMIADGHEFYGVECSAELKVLTQEGARAAHLHTNHCFDPVLRKRERVSRGSNTFERLNLASTVFAQQRPANLDELWKLMASHDGAPHSLCSHLDDHYGDPNASRTCGMIAMRPSAGNLRVVRGCAFTQPAIDLSLERYAGRK
jgi:isopenicillin-N N-acyltransferase-like protein